MRSITFGLLFAVLMTSQATASAKEVTDSVTGILNRALHQDRHEVKAEAAVRKESGSVAIPVTVTGYILPKQKPCRINTQHGQGGLQFSHSCEASGAAKLQVHLNGHRLSLDESVLPFKALNKAGEVEEILVSPKMVYSDGVAAVRFRDPDGYQLLEPIGKVDILLAFD